MRSERDKCGDLYYYGTPREERPRWQNIARETDRNPQASYGASRVIVQYTGDVNGRAFDSEFEDYTDDELRVDQQSLGRVPQHRDRTGRSGKRGAYFDSEEIEADKNRRRSKSHGAKHFLNDHFDFESDMGLVAGVGGGLAGAVIGRKIGKQNTYASVAGALAGAVAANALENQWKKHKMEGSKRLKMAKRKEDVCKDQNHWQKNKGEEKSKEKKDKRRSQSWADYWEELGK